MNIPISNGYSDKNSDNRDKKMNGKTNIKLLICFFDITFSNGNSDEPI